MDKKLEILIGLQALDSEITKLDEIKKSIPGQMERVEKEYEFYRRELDAAREKQSGLQKDLKAREIEAEAEKERMSKTHRNMLQVKTNKEYAAALAEIETAKSKISALEDAILDSMESIEQQKVAIAQKTRFLEQKEAERKDGLREKEEEKRRVEEELSSRAEQRAGLAARLDTETLNLYLKIWNSRKGLAVVPIKDDTCQGCFILLTPQMVQEIKPNNKIFSCSLCDRILYWQEPDKHGVGETTD